MNLDAINDSLRNDSNQSAGFDEPVRIINETLQAYLAVIDSVAALPTVDFRLRNLFTINFGERARLIIDSYKAGEIFFFSFVEIRYLVTLFVSYHIKSRLRTVLNYLEHEALSASVADRKDTGKVRTIRVLEKNVLALEQLLTKRTKLKLVVALSPILPLVSLAMSFFSIRSPSPILDTLRKITRLYANTYWVMVLSLYVLQLIPSSFVAKRRVMLSQSVYSLEKELFKAIRHGRRTREKPIDLILFTSVALLGFGGCLVTIVLYPFEIISLLAFICGVGIGIHLVGSGYAFIRRAKLDNW